MFAGDDAMFGAEIGHMGELGMDALDVVAFLEGVHHHLPVAFDGFAHVHAMGYHFVDPVGFEHVLRITEEIGQRCGVRIGIEEDEAGEAFDRYRDQPEVFLWRTDELVDRAVEIRPGDRQALSIQPVRPVMVGAGEARGIAAALAKGIAAMPAGVDEAADFPVASTDDNVGLVEQPVFDPVARFGNFLGASGDMPHPHPQIFALAGVIVRIPIAVRRDLLCITRKVELAAQRRLGDALTRFFQLGCHPITLLTRASTHGR